jgi:ubiquinone/menaquinone biosynthesis C-methylase UbiE
MESTMDDHGIRLAQEAPSLDPDTMKRISDILKGETYTPPGMDVMSKVRHHLDPVRAIEQFAVLKRYVPELEGKRLLEVGLGFGSFQSCARAMGVETFGLEPGWRRARAARRVWPLLSEPEHNLVIGVGEHLPFDDGVFDVVYSTNVLEHVQDPWTVLQEAFRVLKPGGYLQFIFPNYGSVWEGHYCIPWLPYTPRWLGKLYVRLLGHDPSFLDTLQTGLTPIWVKRALRSLGNVRVVSMGLEVFQERLISPKYEGWEGTATLIGALQLLRRLGVANILQLIVRVFSLYTPFILTLQKPAPQEIRVDTQ